MDVMFIITLSFIVVFGLIPTLWLAWQRKQERHKISKEDVLQFSPTWAERANLTARRFCPPIHPCKACSEPVVSGYYCTWCGAASPGRVTKKRP